MANVKFAYGSTTPTTSTSGFDDGCIYFNTSTNKIHLRQGSSVYTFDGNNTTYSYSSFPQLNKITSKYVSGTMSIPQGGTTYTYEGSTRTTIAGIVTGYSPSQNVTSISGNFDSSNGNTTVTISYQSNSKPASWASSSTPYSLTIFYIPSQS